MKRLLDTRPLSTDLGILFLRLLFGGLFMYYGKMKVENYDQYLPMFKDVIGLGSKLSYNLVIFAELGCGFLVLIGFFTRLTVLPILFSMLVAWFTVHAKDPFLVKQIVFLYIGLAIVVFIFGSGRFSVDYLLQRKKKRN